jgi:hypothetical protein
MWTKRFWKESAERAVKSGAQALLGLWALDGFNIVDADFGIAAGTAVGAVVLSLLTSVVSLPFGEPNDPSAVSRV